MAPHELRATLDRLDLSAAEAGHLLGVHRATIYRWLDGSMSVPIVVELLLCLMVRRGIRPAEVTVVSWSDKRKAAVGPIAGEIGKADCPPQYRCQVQAGRGAGSAEPAAWRDHCGHDAGDRLAVPFGARFPGRGGYCPGLATAIRTWQ